MAVITRADFRGLQRAVTSVALLSKPGTANKLTRAGVREGAKYVTKVMKKRVIKGRTTLQPGTLRKAVAQKVKTYRYSNTTVAVIGPRTNYKQGLPNGKIKRPSKYAHFVESGHGGRGRYSGDPFLKPTLQATHAQAEKLAAKGIMAAIAKELLKGRK